MKTCSVLLKMLVFVCALACVGALDAKTLHYLKAGAPDPAKMLKPPPAPGSSEEAADLKETVAIHERMTRAEEKLAKSEKDVSAFSFKKVIGPFFDADKLPKTKAFFKRAQSDADEAADAAQNFWKRPHPYALEPKLTKKNDVIDETNFGYPSGHSTESTVLALVLAEIFPEKKEAILTRGRELGWYRVQLAKHYPTDFEAGREFGAAIFRDLKANPDFQRDLSEVKKEIAAAQR